MKKVLVLIGAVIIITIISIVVYNNIHKDPDGGSGNEIIIPKAKTAEIIDKKTSTGSSQFYTNCVIPQFSDLTDNDFQEELNKKIENTINPYLDELTVVTEDNLSQTARYTYETSFDRYDNDFSYSPIYEGGVYRYVSLVVSHNYDTQGMRSNKWKDTYVVDYTENKLMTLRDMCDFNNYEDAIITEVNRQAKERDIELFNGEGLKSLSENQKFYVKDDKLIIYFEPASISAYLNGDLEFEMPFKLRDHKFFQF